MEKNTSREIAKLAYQVGVGNLRNRLMEMLLKKEEITFERLEEISEELIDAKEER